MRNKPKLTQAKYHVFILLSSLLSLMPTPSYAQIAHIMDRTNGNMKEGISSKVEVSLEKKSGNTETERIIADGGIYFKQDKNLYMLLAKRDFGKLKSVIAADSRFLHARYRRTMTDLFDWEFFTQVDTDEIKRREKRSLIGTGPRLKLLSSDRQHLTLGVAPMLEQEIYIKRSGLDTPDSAVKTRASVSSSYELKIVEPFAMQLSAYYQPNIETAADYRLSLKSALNIQVLTNLSVKVTVEQNTDSMPPEGAKKTDTILKQSFVFNW